MSRVLVNENFKMFHGHQPLHLEAGQVIEGSLAELLAKTARKRVTVLEDEQPDPERGEQDPPHPPPPPPAQDPNDGDPSTPPDPEAPTALAPAHDAPVKDLLAWVGDDPDRARELLDLEEAKDQPRSTLVKQLAKIADA